MVSGVRDEDSEAASLSSDSVSQDVCCAFKNCTFYVPSDCGSIYISLTASLLLIYFCSFFFLYPHMPIGKVCIYRLLFVYNFVCLYGYGFLRRG